MSTQLSSTRPSVCIVTPSYLSSTPRVVKEADALHAAGFRVRVVFSQGNLSLKREHDADLLAEKSWRWDAVQWARRGSSLLLWARSGIRQRVCRHLPAAAWPYAPIAERAISRVYPELARAAASEPADLYVGHYPTGLAAAAKAARRRHASLAYDAEDFHTGEGDSEEQNRRIDFIQRRYLPECAHVTAASYGIASALAETYGIACPVAIHNVFPWADRQHLDGRIKDRRGPELSLYWCSQTIGLDRGIQDAIRALGLLGGPAQLHLQGTSSDAARAALEELARECGVADRVFFHPQVPPGELLSRTAEHDVGLTLEQGLVLNKAICTTNKLFHCLLAGLAVAATDVPGQRWILGELGNAGALYLPGDYQTLAAHLERWRSDPDALRRAKEGALAAARDRWNWESESELLVEQVTRTLERRRLARIERARGGARGPAAAMDTLAHGAA